MAVTTGRSDVNPQVTAPVYRRGSLRRSVALFRAFLVEQRDPDHFYSLLARDSVAEVLRWTTLSGRSVVDVGGGPGYFADAFAAEGARYAGIEPDAGELSARGEVGVNALRGSGTQLPLADHSVDIAYSSNVLEHVPAPETMAEEMLRVTRPGGTVVLSWTPWLSPWGGHETAPWHYLGGYRAANRYARKEGKRPKNDYGTSLFACSVGRMMRWARALESRGEVRIVEVLPRYHPRWARWVIRVPGLREVVAWNAVIVLERA
ncbi:class I SAM-dependent methyltransferase [Janibacter sp. GXQ6167]|uniref:class I SAM-dependent methyltransferase n=1 Tax=Janibacter sp. GXQ6167 TaxID=3240791 RepID=UPI003526A1D4